MTGKNVIGFENSALGLRTFQTFNPLTNNFNETLFYQATDEEIAKAVDLSLFAFEKLKHISSNLKADFLTQIIAELEINKIDILRVYCNESGLPIERGEIEFQRTINQLVNFSKLLIENNWREISIDEADPTRTPPKPDLRKMLYGIGPVVVFGASNFPLAYSTIGGDSVAALAAGCPVIVKSHPMHAGTGELVALCVQKAAKLVGMPDGVFSNLNAADFSVGQKLIMHPKIKAVGFTGSISGGRAIFDLANSRKEPIPVFAEMGSVNPVIFLDSAFLHDSDKWSSIYADSISASTGQFCTNPGLLFMVQSHESEEFVQAVTQKFLEKEASCMLNPTILANFNSNKTNRVSVEGVSFKEKNGELQGNYASQTIAKVSGSDFLKNSLLQEEVFGPFSIAVMCNGLDQLYECVSILNGQLTASLIGSEQDLLKNNALINLLQNKVGRLIFNGVPTGVEINPSMQHGGPYPSSTDSRFTAVGIDSIKRFARPITYQNCPDAILPSELKDHNPLNLKRRVNGKWS